MRPRVRQQGANNTLTQKPRLRRHVKQQQCHPYFFFRKDTFPPPPFVSFVKPIVRCALCTLHCHVSPALTGAPYHVSASSPRAQSLGIHLPQCRKMFEAQEAKKPTKQRRKVPSPPPGYLEAMNKVVLVPPSPRGSGRRGGAGAHSHTLQTRSAPVRTFKLSRSSAPLFRRGCAWHWCE